MIQEAVLAAERSGFWAVVLPDHYVWRSEADVPPNISGESTLDTWTALSYLAAKTESIRLGTLVTPIPRYQPGTLAKIVATLDIITDGRVLLGVGAGSSQSDLEGYSEWNEPNVRVEKTQEGVELILKLWTEKTVNFHGKYYHAKNAVLEPKPLQKPHPPLLFGGEHPRMLRMAGRYADICLIPPWTKLSYAEARRIALREAEHYGRREKLSLACLEFRPKYDPEEHRKTVEKADRNGFDYFIVGFWHENCLDSTEKFAREIIPSFAS